MRTAIALAVFALVVHVSLSWWVYTTFGPALFAVYTGAVTGGLSFEGVQHRRRYHS